MKRIGLQSWRISMLLLVWCTMGVALMGGKSAMAEETATLRLALLPVPDVFPVYVAQAKGYFEEAGITVEALPVGSAVERDQLQQAGSIDGMINEVGGAMLFNRDKVQMKIVSFARIPMGDAPLFGVLAAPGTTKKAVADLAGVPVAVLIATGPNRFQ